MRKHRAKLNITLLLAVLAVALPWSALAQDSGEKQEQPAADQQPPATEQKEPAAAAQPESPGFWQRPVLTNDWGGARTKISEKGVNFGLNLSQLYQNVVSGGRHTKGAYGAKFNAQILIDANKLLGAWKGLGFYVHVEGRAGNDVLKNAGVWALPNTMLLYPLPGQYDGINVTSLMVTQTLAGGKFQLAGGKLNAFDLVSQFFPNTADYGLKGFINPNATVSALPWLRWINLSLYGAGAWTIKDGMVQTGTLVLGETNVSTSWDPNRSFADGVGLVGFHRFYFKMNNKPGYVLLFGGGSTKRYPNLEPIDWLPIPGGVLIRPEERKPKNPYGFATYFSQIVWQAKGNPKRFAQIFTGGSVADSNPSFFKANYFASIQAFGPIGSRPNDRTGVAGWYNLMNDDYRVKASELPFINLQPDLWGFEFFYNFEVSGWLHLTPSIQILRNEHLGDDVAIVPGVRLVLDL